MPRLFLALVACLLALGPQRVCACRAVPCPDAGCPLADAKSECGHHHHHEDGDDDTEPGQPDGHKHHDQGCPAIAVVSAPALPAPDSASVDAPNSVGMAVSPADGMNGPAFKAICSFPPCPPAPHVPLHVSLQVFRN